MGRVRDEKGIRKKIREEKQKKGRSKRKISRIQQKEEQRARKSRKVARPCVFPMFGGSGGSKSSRGGWIILSTQENCELLTLSRPKFFGGPYSNQHPTLIATTPWPISTMPVLISPIITHHIPSPMAFFPAAISWDSLLRQLCALSCRRTPQNRVTNGEVQDGDQQLGERNT